MSVLRLLSLCFIFLGLVACSGKPVKTYEGDALAEAEQAILIAGENIEIEAVNGKSVQEYLLKNIETKYALKPGKTSVVFKYTSVWATPGRSSESKSELIESASQYVEFDAQAGGVYTFEFEQVEDRREARKMAENFTANIMTLSGGTVAASAVYVPPKDTSGSTDGFGSVADCQPLETEMSDLDMMKKRWEASSQQDRKAFLKWAFQ